MPTPADHHRELAAETVDEVSAFVCAGLATGEPAGELYRTLVSIRDTLESTARAIRTCAGTTLEPAPLQSASSHSTDDRRRVGRSMAAAMLRLGRAASRRALRDLSEVPETDASIREYVSDLPQLLGALADQLDAEEARSLPIGICVRS